MFSVKHIREDGTEQIYAGSSVMYYPGSVGNAASVTVPEAGCALYSGTVYVMNDAGSTVSKYDLGACPGFGVSGLNSPPA
jgi:hypothetical protein